MLRAILPGLVVVAISAGAARAVSERCRVSDPSGTPLNVRTQPLGKVIDALPNGLDVKILDEAPAADGRPWAYIVDGATDRRIGWVARRLLACE